MININTYRNIKFKCQQCKKIVIIRINDDKEVEICPICNGWAIKIKKYEED